MCSPDFEKRISEIRRRMEKQNLDILFVTKPEDKYYLSGFESSNFYIVLTDKSSYMLTDFRYFEAARKKNCQGFEIIKVDSKHSIFDFLSKYDKMSIGIEEKHLTADEFKILEQIFTSEKIFFSQNIFEEQRLIKDSSEIRSIRKAAEIADYAFSNILKHIGPGMSEREIAIKMESFMKKEGASRLSFDIIAASGERSALPHGLASERIIQKGDFLTLDFGCMVDHYCSDMTRTVAIGKASDEKKSVYNTVKDAQQAALDKVKPGISTSEADKIARSIIDRAGYGECFGHGLGHGVGLEVHEAPRLSPSCHSYLREGMVVTVEPGIYIADSFGVRIEDLVVITQNGIDNLTTSNKELIII